jgi:hypothetical protein
MKRLLVIALVVAACGGGSSGDASTPPSGNGLVGPSNGLATEEPLATENVASEPPASEPPASQPPSTPALPVKVTKSPGTVARGATASTTIKTTKAALCDIDVKYDSGSSTAKGLGDERADAQGVATWKWNVGRNTHTGPVPVTITCTLGDRTGTAETTLTVK